MRLKSIIVLIMWVLILSPQACKQQKGKITASPEDLITAKTLGLAYLEENQLEDAETEFLKLVDMDPGEVMAYANLGIVYLRMGEFDDSETWLQKAIKMEPEDPDVRLILAKLYEMSESSDKAVEELEKIIGFSPGHVKALYNLTVIYATFTDENSHSKWLDYTKELVEQAPGNLVPRLNLIEILLNENQNDAALEQMEELVQIFPEFPKEAVEYYNATLAALRASDLDESLVSFMIFHNYLKVTSIYQAGMMDLKGPGGSLVGSPVISFDQQKSSFLAGDWKEVLEAISFTDITSSSGLDFMIFGDGGNESGSRGSTHITACDYDNDGDIDLYAGHFDPSSQSFKHFLLNNDWGIFKDVSDESGIRHQGAELSARFADYNNDGHPDLFILMDGSNLLYRNSGEGTFEDVSGKANMGEGSMGTGSLFFDYDHDGDLDLFVPKAGPNLLLRNNSDDTFLDMSEPSGLMGGDFNSSDAGFGDFDEDGDIDLMVVNSDGSNAMYSNQREGLFRDMADQAGLDGEDKSSAIAIGDYNNDGFLDLFVASLEEGKSSLYKNLGDGSFEMDLSSEELESAMKYIRARDATFLDFDNDGYLDLMVVGESTEQGGSGVVLYHNDGSGKFWLAPGLLPENLSSGKKILTFDYNDDGDLDLAVSDLDGSVRLLRNDGGNNHHFIKMKLVGLRAGSAKNNYYGIGARVEVRSGSLYQSMVVTEPNIHIGLGPREKAEVIRIVWTNGVPQNMFFPKTDQDLVEEQLLKGSCPFLYTWNGEEYTFVKDVMWRSALGMPLGIMGGGAKAYAPADASVDYIKIPGTLLKEQDSKYSLQITSELWETIFLDKLQLVVVDHPASVEIIVDEQLAPPSAPGFLLYQVEAKKLPVSASDHHGNSILSQITHKDDSYVSGFQYGKYQGTTEMSEMLLDLGEIDETKSLNLFLRGWIFPTDASINASISQSDVLEMIPPSVEAIDENGQWKTVVENLGIPMGKDKTIVADLSGKVRTSDPRIRIRTNMQLYWDQVFFIQDQPELPVQTFWLNPSNADLHHRGFSKTFRKGGRYGPHWFEYGTVSTGQKWRDLTGNYTRYGDVRSLLLESDDMYVIKNAGDETTVEFDAQDIPVLPEGWERDFLIHSVGWVKDGDMNTASGQTVEPLPFHGMTHYPYGTELSYPSDPEHQEYLQKYNTRKVTTDDFRRTILEAKIPSD